MLGAAMDGQISVGGVTANLDASFSDIVDRLEFSVMLNYRAEKDKLSLNLDTIFMALGADTPNGLATVDFDQTLIEGSAGWKVHENFELVGGLRYNELDGTLRGRATATPIYASQDASWIDPFVGAWARLPLAPSFALILRGDVGGFGVGSEMAYQAAAYLRYQTSGTLSFVAGWRYLDQRYEDGEGARRFVYDVATQGPTVGITWNF
jgi:hypothetical protein